MLLEIILSLVLGIIAGIFTGLIPGIHINLIGAGIISLSSVVLYKINPLNLIVFVVAMAITHTFTDFIPSVFLGCPDTDTELSILPGHNFLKKGYAHAAILLSSYGGLFAIFLLAIIVYPSIIIIDHFYTYLEKIIAPLLILVSIFLISIEKEKTKALLVFVSTGILGYLIFNSNINEPLLPLLSGLFGASNIILSLKNKTIIPPQTKEKLKTKFSKPVFSSLVASPLCSFLPGMGSGQAAIIANTISKSDQKGFLVLLGATNTLVMGFSFISLYTIGKTRTGAALAIKEIINLLNSQTLILILIVTLISGILAFLITKKLSEKISEKINRINYTKISIITLSILLILVLLISSISGLIVFSTATLTGIYSIKLGVKRTFMMGCLLIPTILFYLV